MPERKIGANNKTQFLLHIWNDDGIPGQLLVMMQNPASPCKKDKNPIRKQQLIAELVESGILASQRLHKSSLLAMI